MTKEELSSDGKPLAPYEAGEWPPEGALPVNWNEPTPYEIVALMIRAMSESWECNVTPDSRTHSIMVTNVMLLKQSMFHFTPELVRAIALGEGEKVPDRMKRSMHYELLDKELTRIYEEHAL